VLVASVKCIQSYAEILFVCAQISVELKLALWAVINAEVCFISLQDCRSTVGWKLNAHTYVG